MNYPNANKENWSMEKAMQAQQAQVGAMCQAEKYTQDFVGVPKDKSPIEVQLDEQYERLLGLRDAVNSLIDPLLSILNGDPRAQPACEKESQVRPISCELEGVIRARNDAIGEQTAMLREIRQLLCL